jgi:hypothetical protein
MNQAIFIKLGRDINGNQTLLAKAQDFVKVRRQRDKSISLENDLKAIAVEFNVKNGLFKNIENKVYEITENEFVATFN